MWIWPPTAFRTFIIVENWGFKPCDNALYKFGLLIPVSCAILVMPIAFAICPIAVTISSSLTSSNTALNIQQSFRYYPGYPQYQILKFPFLRFFNKVHQPKLYPIRYNYG